MFINAGGHLLNAVRFGSGPDVFVAHGGWVGNWELWQEPFMLMHDRWQCIAYDHRGSGVSTAPSSAISPEGLIDDLFVVLDALEVDRCVLAGESMGSLVCAAAVLRDPSRFSGLVLVDGMHAVTRESAGRQIDGSRSDYPATVRRFTDACIPEPDSEHIRRWGRQILLRAEPEAAARILEVYTTGEADPDFSMISVPTLLVHGEADVIVPIAEAEKIASAIVRSSLVRIPEAGHVPTLTRPAEVVAAIDSWWTQQRGVPRSRIH